MSEGRVETDAYKVDSEIRQKLNSDDSYCYKPWQFSDYNVNACTLKTTYEEIVIWTRQQAMFRPGWKIEDGKVFLPNIFAKVVGVHPSIRLYRKEIKTLRNQENTVFFSSFPMFRPKVSIITGKNYYSVLDASGYIDKYKLLNSPFWKYRHLRTSLQNAIADRIIEFCNLTKFKNYEAWAGEPKRGVLDGVADFLKNFDIILNTSPNGFDTAKIKLFQILNDIEEPFTKLLTKFDYPGIVPKVMVYNNGSKYSKINLEDAVKLVFMNSMGADVIIFNPSGYNDIEDYIREQHFDIHRLQELSFNLPYSSWTLF